MRLLSVLFALGLAGQQIGDPNWKPKIDKPAYPAGKGPVVLLDEAHNNFHKLDGRYKPFGELLTLDGYRMQANRAPFTRESLAKAGVLVIANALHASNVEKWQLPTPPAFTQEENVAVEEWVKAGGGLLLIADHMPFPGAVADLARRFEITFSNGFAVPRNEGGGTITFRRSDNSLREHAVTKGINEVMTFTGSAFYARTAEPLLVFPGTIQSLEPDTAWKFDDRTDKRFVAGWLQGAVLQHGKGRVAVFGEAAMFSAQLAGENKTPMGMNAPGAAENYRFLLNVMAWLTGR